jgi:hypothetical protein
MREPSHIQTFDDANYTTFDGIASFVQVAGQQRAAAESVHGTDVAEAEGRESIMGPDSDVIDRTGPEGRRLDLSTGTDEPVLHAGTLDVRVSTRTIGGGVGGVADAEKLL